MQKRQIWFCPFEAKQKIAFAPLLGTLFAPQSVKEDRGAESAPL